MGPRQVGKTTLARALGGTYFDLELETERLRLDLVLEVAGSRWAVGCKLSTQPDQRDLKRLTVLADAIGAERRFLLSHSSEIIESDSGVVYNLPWLLANMKRLIRA